MVLINYWLDSILLDEMVEDLEVYLKSFVGMPYESERDALDDLYFQRLQFLTSNPEYLRIGNRVQIEILLDITRDSFGMPMFISIGHKINKII